jgi:hypothetical protein
MAKSHVKPLRGPRDMIVIESAFIRNADAMRPKHRMRAPLSQSGRSLIGQRRCPPHDGIAFNEIVSWVGLGYAFCAEARVLAVSYLERSAHAAKHIEINWFDHFLPFCAWARSMSSRIMSERLGNSVPGSRRRNSSICSSRRSVAMTCRRRSLGFGSFIPAILHIQCVLGKNPA